MQYKKKNKLECKRKRTKKKKNNKNHTTKNNTPGLSAGNKVLNGRRKRFGQKNTWTEKTHPE